MDDVKSLSDKTIVLIVIWFLKGLSIGVFIVLKIQDNEVVYMN